MATFGRCWKLIATSGESVSNVGEAVVVAVIENKIAEDAGALNSETGFAFAC